MKTKKNPAKNVTPLSNELTTSPQPFRSNALLSEPLRQVLLGRAKISYISHALLKWCRNKRQFKDILSSTCPSGSEKRALDLNGWGCEFNAQWGNILLLDYFLFSCSKVCDANIVIIVNSVCSWKTLLFGQFFPENCMNMQKFWLTDTSLALLLQIRH